MAEAKTYLAPELKKKIKEKAKAKGITLASFIRQALIEKLENLEKA
jgi:predicted HicB family RNase H-like nuclease